jgi:HEAT repeat protein
VVEFVVAQRHGLAAPGALDGGLREAAMRRVVEAAHELVARIHGDRGAAFGLGGAFRGFGLPALKRLGLLQALEAAAAEPKDAAARQGAMMAFECLCEALGPLFEPFVTRALPVLLRGVGDSSRDVQEAASRAARSVMGILTGVGVRLVMPAVLQGLAETSWRSKQASIQLLGSMAFCAPRMLSSCLPQIVPRLVQAFEDPHPNVQRAGMVGLEDIGMVIRNPVVRSLARVDAC